MLRHRREAYRCAHDSHVPDDRTLFVALDHERLGYDPLQARASAPRTPRVDALRTSLSRGASSELDLDALALALLLELRGGPTARLRPYRLRPARATPPPVPRAPRRGR